MKLIPRHPMAVATLLALAGFSTGAQAAEGEGWDWIVAPYAWIAGIGTDLETRVPPDGGMDIDRNFDDIVDNLDGAFEVHAEGQGDQFGAFTDFTYIALSDSKDFTRFDTESDFDARLFELAAVWSPGEERYRGWELFAGLRYIDVDVTLQLDPVDPAFNNTTIDAGESFSDFMLGARYTFALSDRWALTLRGDGSVGDTEGTWNTSAIAHWQTRYGAWFFGYRYLSVELETRDSTTDISVSGPLVGYGFVF